VTTVPTLAFAELVKTAEHDPAAFRAIPATVRLRAIRDYYQSECQRIREYHRTSVSGRSVVIQLTALADHLVRGIVRFGLSQAGCSPKLRKRIAVCALGGYGRGELNPFSDLDLCLTYTGRLDAELHSLNEFLVPLLWDVGFKSGYVLQEVKDAVRLAASDPEVVTSYMHARLLYGESAVFAQLEKGVQQVLDRKKPELLAFLQERLIMGQRSRAGHDLYEPEPDVKENVGGLRDFHALTWIIRLTRGNLTLDDLEKLGELLPEDNLRFQESLDFILRIRNELHFHCGKGENRLTFALQKQVANAFGYGDDTRQAIDRLMQDYYAAARSIRRVLQIVVGITQAMPAAKRSPVADSRERLEVVKGELCSADLDPRWYAENPARLMETIWECGRRNARLSHTLREAMKRNLDLVGDEFRRNELVRRFFIAICSRPMNAGFALRQAAETGLLGAYIPEFAEVDGVVRYEDFHSYPVDEHTLRAIEALAAIPNVEGPTGRLLQMTLEHLRDPYVLVIAILLHDLGKAGGEEHVEEGVRLARAIGARIGLPEEDTERIVFLVQHHMLMNHIAMYRDTDDLDIISSFAETMRTPDRLSALLLLSYADFVRRWTKCLDGLEGDPAVQALPEGGAYPARSR
jgi:[protein-PII] uridylyltransferase